MHVSFLKRRPAAAVCFAAVILVLAAVLFWAFGASADDPEAEFADFGYQTVAADSVESDETSLRFLFTVGSLDYDRVGFVFSKTNQNPTVGGVGCTVKETTVVYSSITAEGNSVPAPNGRHWVALKLTDVGNEFFDTPVYVNAFVEDGKGVRYATAESVTVCQAFGIEKIAAAFRPILRFAVASDVHYTESVSEQDEKFETLLSDAYGYSDNHAKYQALDGVFIVGDIAHRGKESELNRFFSDFYAWTRPGTEAQAVLGNHEFWPEPEYAVSRYLSASGYETADRHITIAGYHFILMSPSHYAGFNDAKIAWLETELAAAAADDPTGKKPIFVFQHHPAYDTVYGSEDEWGVTNLEPVFENYPQVVDFAGHSHFPINDPRSVWQGSFTAFNTGSCREWGMDLADFTTKTVFAVNDEGDWTFDENASYLYDPGKYYVVEVNAASRVLVRAFDVGTGCEVIEPIFLASVGDPDRFTYTDNRATREETPRFAENAEVETVNVTNTAASFRFPRTASGAYVQHYRCELRQGETLIATERRLDCGFLFPAPETLTLSFTGLSPDTEYTVTIIPVTSWENEGEPLVFAFSTPDLPVQIFSAVFSEDGTAQDAVSGETLTKRGDPTTVYDESRDAYYAEFDGDDAFEFYGIADYYSYLTSSFTFETYLCMDGKPTGDKVVAPFSNQEGGGFGFEYNASGRMDFWIKVNGDWISAGTTLATGEWTHLAATFDGSVLILYVNGIEADRTAVSGTPATPNANHLSVGADSKGNNGSENFAACKVAVANVYRVAKTADEVAKLYASLTE
ncbi:MAG: metallophosphoesterase [Clostridia bacterium]|nr:metallophosphoesterase [Clostridia bacterium]